MGNTFSHLAACSGELSTSPQPGCLAQSPRLWAWWATRLGVARSRAQRPWSAGRELQCGAVDGAKLNRSEIQRGVTVSIFMQTNQFTDQRSGDENQLALPFNLAVAADPAQVAVAGIERILQAGRIGARRGRVNRRRRYLAQRFMRPLVIELVAEVIEALLLGRERGRRRPARRRADHYRRAALVASSARERAAGMRAGSLHSRVRSHGSTAGNG